MERAHDKPGIEDFGPEKIRSLNEVGIGNGKDLMGRCQ